MGMINYNTITEETLNRIREIRAEYASGENNISQEAIDAVNSKVFDFHVENHSIYEFVNKAVERCLYEVLETIIMSLCYKCNIKAITRIQKKTPNEIKLFPIMDMFAIYKKSPEFVIVITESDEPVLYCFRKYGINYKMNKAVMDDILYKLNIKKYHEISLVENNAFTECNNHNDDAFDSSRGTNTYSLKWFFESKFGAEEYKAFKEFADSLTTQIKQYLGFAVVKTLTPNALFSFKKSIENEILKYPYVESIQGRFSDNQMNELKKQYIDNKYYRALLREGTFNSRFNIEGGQFSESFITAEWLYHSLPHAGKVDLTAIAMGYFKSIEELLFVFVSAHVGERKWIETRNRPENWESIPLRDRYWRSPVCDNTIRNKKQYIMMERMITFIKEYEDLFKDNDIRDYLVERLQDAQQLRNGYFHKDNLSDMAKVIKARDDAYVIYMLLLGTMRIDELGKEIIGIPLTDVNFEMLCDHINYYCRMAYYYENENKELVFVIGQPDKNIIYDEHGNATYSGVYFNRLIDFPVINPVLSLGEVAAYKQEKIHFDDTNIPSKIFQGTFYTCKEGIYVTGPKTLIWDKGIFLASR